MRDQAGFVWLDNALRDIRYAFRGLRRSPGFTLSSDCFADAWFGSEPGVFTVADNLLVRPLPYRDASRLMMIWESRERRRPQRCVARQLSGLEVAERRFRRHCRAFADPARRFLQKMAAPRSFWGRA